MSVDREVDLEVDLEENRLEGTVTERVEFSIEDLFRDGELRLWEDSDGWSGYIREETDDDVAFYHVNTHHDEDDWLRKVRVGEQAVRDAVRRHIENPNAGGAGTFERRCSPP